MVKRAKLRPVTPETPRAWALLGYSFIQLWMYLSLLQRTSVLAALHNSLTNHLLLWGRICFISSILIGWLCLYMKSRQVKTADFLGVSIGSHVVLCLASVCVYFCPNPAIFLTGCLVMGASQIVCMTCWGKAALSYSQKTATLMFAGAFALVGPLFCVLLALNPAWHYAVLSILPIFALTCFLVMWPDVAASPYRACVPKKTDAIFNDILAPRLLAGIALITLIFGFTVGVSEPATHGDLEALARLLASGVALSIFVFLFFHEANITSAYRPFMLLFIVGVVSLPLLVSSTLPLAVSRAITGSGFVIFTIAIWALLISLTRRHQAHCSHIIATGNAAILIMMGIGIALGNTVATTPPLNQQTSLQITIALLTLAAFIAFFFLFNESDFEHLWYTGKPACAGQLQHQHITPRKAAAELASTYQLSRREHEILRLVLMELKTSEICEALDIASGTLKVHLRNIYRKTDVHSRIELVEKSKVDPDWREIEDQSEA